MLTIHLEQITEQGLDLSQAVEACTLPLLNAVCQEGSLRFTRPVDVRIHATIAGETILIEGKLSTGVRLACSRCLDPFDLKIDTDISTTALPDMTSMSTTDAGDDTELKGEDIDVIFYHGKSIDLGDEIAQQIIMALPFKPLCSQTCKGLCSHCGADLNKAPCQCPAQDESSPFAVLKSLSLPKKQE
jgi:uncharacterized protein